MAKILERKGSGRSTYHTLSGKWVMVCIGPDRGGYWKVKNQ